MLFRNASWSAIASAYRAGAGLLSTLLAVKLLGAESYGNIAVLLSIFALCLSLASAVFVVFVAKSMAVENNTTIGEKHLLHTAANILALASIIFIFAFAALLAHFADHLRSFDVHNDLFWDFARSSPLILAAFSGLQIYSLLNSAMIESAGRLDLAMKSQMLGPTIVTSGLATLLLLMREVSITEYLTVLCLGAGADLLIIWIVRRVLIREQLSFSCWRDAIHCIPDLLKSGSAIQFSAFMNIFLEPLNKLLLTQFAGGGAVAAYDLAMKLIWGLQALFGSVMRVFLHLKAQGADVIVSTYVRAISLLAVPVLAAHIFGALLLSTFAHYWVALEQKELMLFYGIATLSNLSMIYISPLYVSLIAHDDRGFLFKNQVRLTVANVVASTSLIPLLGLVGAAIGLCAAALYNATAIYMQFQKVVGQVSNFRQMITSIGWRYFLAFSLLISSLLLGSQKVLNVVFLVLVSLAVLLLLIREPIIGELKRRFIARAE